MNKLYYPDFSSTPKKEHWEKISAKSAPLKKRLSYSEFSESLKKTSYFWLFWLPKKEVKSNLIKWNKIFEKINIMELFQDIYNLLVTCNVATKTQFIKTRFKNAVRLIMIEISMYRRYNASATRCNITSYIIYFWVMQGINTRRIIYKGLGWQI